MFLQSDRRTQREHMWRSAEPKECFNNPVEPQKKDTNVQQSLKSWLLWDGPLEKGEQRA